MLTLGTSQASLYGDASSSAKEFCEMAPSSRNGRAFPIASWSRGERSLASRDVPCGHASLHYVASRIASMYCSSVSLSITFVSTAISAEYLCTPYVACRASPGFTTPVSWTNVDLLCGPFKG